MIEIIKPVGEARVSQKFGMNPQMYAKYNLAGHNGIDYGIREGTPIKAVADGRVSYIGDDPDGYGFHLKINHDGFQTVSAHGKEKPIVQVGDYVKKGQVVMLSGNTGNSTGPHLHFGLREFNEDGTIKNYDNGYKGYIDPMPYFVKVMPVISEWAKEDVQKAKDKGYIVKWDDPQGIMKVEDIEMMFSKIGLIENTGKGLSRERWAVLLNKLNLL